MELNREMLYVGTNYHPHDWPKERWKEDIRLMKEAGLSIVRMGHLCWDSYEPEEGVYTFEWFDEVMDLFAEAGIGVFLDVSTRPAPLWVHKLCPGCNMYGRGRNFQASLNRYLEDVEDPGFQHYALRFARVFVNRYKSHPALFGFGMCNELGSGQMSFSENARKRFQNWLKKKYKTTERLNRAWATQRWSRRLSSFEDVELPVNEMGRGAPESWLDMRRFYSDGIAEYLIKLHDVIKENAPGTPISGNLFSNHEALGFDYLKHCDRFMEYPAMGFYPQYDMEADKLQNCISTAKEYMNEAGRPIWFLEFQTGRDGVFCGPKGYLHMLMMLGILNRAQMILGWTWRSMYGGEEQYHHGILGHDGLPTPNYEEIKKASADMQKLSRYGFPWVPAPEIGVAVSSESGWVADYQKGQFRQRKKACVAQVQKAFWRMQREYNVVNLRNLKKKYRLLIVPGHILMDPESAAAIRSYVENGGTAIMTGYSATVDENGQVYTTPRPGALSDVFGVRVAGFYRTDMPGFFSEGCEVKKVDGKERELLQVKRNDEKLTINIDYYEYLELNGASAWAEYEGKGMPAVTANRYGKGMAFYMAAETNALFLEWLVEKLAEELELTPALKVPDGIQARKIAEHQYFYVNTTNRRVEVPLEEAGRGVLCGKEYGEVLTLEGYESELVTGKEKQGEEHADQTA